MSEEVKIRSENVTRKVDNLGRTTIPKWMRNRFNLQTDDLVEFYSAEIDGVEYICLKKVDNDQDYGS